MRIIPLLLANLVLAAGAPAYATDLYSGSLNGTGTMVHQCISENKGTGNISVTTTIYNAVTGLPEHQCGPSTILPGRGQWCAITLTNIESFCKVKTSSSANTRAAHQLNSDVTLAKSTTPVR